MSASNFPWQGWYRLRVSMRAKEFEWRATRKESFAANDGAVAGGRLGAVWAVGLELGILAGRGVGIVTCE